MNKTRAKVRAACANTCLLVAVPGQLCKKWRNRPSPNPSSGEPQIRKTENNTAFAPKYKRDDGAGEAILIAEDDPVFRRLLQSRLQSWGYRVTAVEDGAAAWEFLLKPDRPDLLILDWIMPGINGIELCRRIREKQRDPYQYILLVSGKDDKQDVISGLEAGADDYLTKPFDVGELRARLRVGERILSLQRELIQAREDLRFRASHDSLTGLWNRSAILELLSCELQRGFRSRVSTGILMIDLDHFKNVNDTYGHLVGDEVIKEAGNRISHAVRSYDFVGRYGGEEFLAILSSCTADDVRTIAERTRRAFAEGPISTDAAAITVTVSIGGVVTTTGTSDPELLSHADSALYKAKRNGRNRAVVCGCKGNVIYQENSLAKRENTSFR